MKPVMIARTPDRDRADGEGVFYHEYRLIFPDQGERERYYERFYRDVGVLREGVAVLQSRRVDQSYDRAQEPVPWEWDTYEFGDAWKLVMEGGGGFYMQADSLHPWHEHAKKLSAELKVLGAEMDKLKREHAPISEKLYRFKAYAQKEFEARLRKSRLLTPWYAGTLTPKQAERVEALRIKTRDELLAEQAALQAREAELEKQEAELEARIEFIRKGKDRPKEPLRARKEQAHDRDPGARSVGEGSRAV